MSMMGSSSWSQEDHKAAARQPQKRKETTFGARTGSVFEKAKGVNDIVHLEVHHVGSGDQEAQVEVQAMGSCGEVAQRPLQDGCAQHVADEQLTGS